MSVRRTVQPSAPKCRASWRPSAPEAPVTSTGRDGCVRHRLPPSGVGEHVHRRAGDGRAHAKQPAHFGVARQRRRITPLAQGGHVDPVRREARHGRPRHRKRQRLDQPPVRREAVDAGGGVARGPVAALRVRGPAVRAALRVADRRDQAAIGERAGRAVEVERLDEAGRACRCGTSPARPATRRGRWNCSSRLT